MPPGISSGFAPRPACPGAAHSVTGPIDDAWEIREILFAGIADLHPFSTDKPMQISQLSSTYPAMGAPLK
jgi:hypothetical protein